MRLCAKSFFGINLNLGVLKGVPPLMPINDWRENDERDKVCN
ncbi:hypothetical protein X926_00120 [Petrotoga sp. HWHPT.55.6.3]|nr:hypothetical protein X926_00120 [Petrotoga sp. HWHPT.55.6.3]